MKGRLIIFMFLLTGLAHGQTFRLDLGYSYLYSKQFDQLMQLYQLSRPNLIEKQPYFDHGAKVEISYLLRSENAWSSGFGISYALVSSYASNSNLDVRFNLQLIDLGYILHYQPDSRQIYGELGIYGTMGVLQKRINGEQFTNDENAVRSIQIGGLMNLKMGYQFMITDRLQISPFIGMNFAPYFSVGQTETVINQTNGLLQERFTNYWQFDGGIRIALNRKK